MNTPHSHVSNGDISTSLSNLSPLQYSGSMQNQSMHNSMAIPQFISYPHYSVSLPSTQSFSNYNESKSEHTGSKARDNTSTRKRKPAQPESPESPSSDPKKKRFQWSKELHKSFVCAIFEFGLRNVSPKSILEFMDPPVEGLSTRHIKSHLQKFRITCRRSKNAMQEEYDKLWQCQIPVESVEQIPDNASEGVNQYAKSISSAKSVSGMHGFSADALLSSQLQQSSLSLLFRVQQLEHELVNQMQQCKRMEQKLKTKKSGKDGERASQESQSSASSPNQTCEQTNPVSLPTIQAPLTPLSFSIPTAIPNFTIPQYPYLMTHYQALSGFPMGVGMQIQPIPSNSTTNPVVNSSLSDDVEITKKMEDQMSMHRQLIIHKQTRTSSQEEVSQKDENEPNPAIYVPMLEEVSLFKETFPQDSIVHPIKQDPMPSFNTGTPIFETSSNGNTNEFNFSGIPSGYDDDEDIFSFLKDAP